MQNSKVRILFLLGVFLILSLLFGTIVFAANENVKIVKESDSKYLFYVKGNLNSTFEFAFTDTLTEPAETEYKEAGKDAAENGNYIAYLDEYSTANKYLWVKNSEGYVLEGVEIDLTQAMDKEDLELLESFTKIIKVDTTQTNVEEKEVDGNKVTVTTGKLVFLNEGNHLYQMFKVSESEDYAKLMDLAERISKFNDDTDTYTKLEVYYEFANLAVDLLNNLDENAWIKVEGNEILQPEDAKNGDKYVVWLIEGDEASGELDVQFLTSKYEEETVKEKITTKLPVTYDDNRLLIVLAVLVIATIVVSVRISSLKKEDK